MLSFNQLHEKKTKVKINPKKEDVMEGDKTLNHGDDCNCMKCDKKRRKDDLGDEKTVSTEELAYDSQEEVSEESNQEIAETEKTLLTFDQLQHAKTLDEEQLQEFLKGLFGGGNKRSGTGPNNAVTGLQNQARQGNLMGSGMIANTAQKMMNRRDQQAAMMKQLLGRSKGGKVKKKKSYKESMEFFEDRAADAQKSLDKVKKRQGVLDDYEKKTGKKLDISKTPEHKSHKQNFPGAKRQAKKVKGAKETPAEKHNRQVQTYTDRLKKYGKTKKQDAYDKAMSKQTSRYD